MSNCLTNLVMGAGNFNVYNFAVLNMLNEADPTAPESGDPPELAGAEEGVINSMAPLIDTGKRDRETRHDSLESRVQFSRVDWSLFKVKVFYEGYMILSCGSPHPKSRG